MNLEEEIDLFSVPPIDITAANLPGLLIMRCKAIYE
jgi:hypothetical protein